MALLIAGLELLRQTAGTAWVIGQQQFEGCLGGPEAAGGIQPWTKNETYVSGGRLVDLQGCNLRQGVQALASSVPDFLQAPTHQVAVLADERRQIRDSAQRHKIQLGFGHTRSEQVSRNGLGQLVGDPDACQVLFRVLITWLLWIHDRQCRRQVPFRGVMVIGDDQIQARCRGRAVPPQATGCRNPQ